MSENSISIEGENIMRKILKMCIVMLCLTCLLITPAFGGNSANKLTVYINGTLFYLTENKDYLVDSKGIIQVSTDFLSQRLGLSVDDFSHPQIIEVETVIILARNSNKIKNRGGTTVLKEMTTKPVSKGEMTYIPLRATFEALGCTVASQSSSGQKVLFITGLRTFWKTFSIDGDVSKTALAGSYEAYVYDWSDFTGTILDEHYITASVIGSNANNILVRQPGTTWEEERTYLNYLVSRGGWGYAKDGMMTIADSNGIENAQSGSFREMCCIYRNDNTRQVSINKWIYNANTSLPMSAVAKMNTVIETLKYYSNSPEDGLKIYAYLNKCFNTFQDPPYGKPLTFGNTTVTFRDNASFGLTVVFQAP